MMDTGINGFVGWSVDLFRPLAIPRGVLFQKVILTALASVSNLQPNKAFSVI